MSSAYTRAETKNIAQANEALYAAVGDGSLEKLNEAVASGADVNFLCDKQLPGWNESDVQKGTGNSALHLTCRLGLDKALIERLLYLGADVHLMSLDCGYLPIHTVTHCGNVELVELLLDEDCNPNAKDSNGFTSLMWASKEEAKRM